MKIVRERGSHGRFEAVKARMYFKGVYDLIMTDTYQRVREVCFGAMQDEAFVLLRRQFPDDGPPICGGVAAIERTSVTDYMPDGHWLATPQAIYYANLETHEMSRWTWRRVVSIEDLKRRQATWIHLEVDHPIEAIDLVSGELSARKLMGVALNYLVDTAAWQPATSSSDLTKIVGLLVDLYSEPWFEWQA
jgi:hypothetical protein